MDISTISKPPAWALGLLLTLLSGCASVNFDQTLAKTGQDTASFTQGQLVLAQTPELRAAQEQAAKEILQKPLSQGDAVRLALVNSPALQSLLAQNWADAAQVAQSGRIANPRFTFESLRGANELELGRLLSFGLLDVLTLPARLGLAQRQIEQSQLRLSSDVITQVTQVRLAWVAAVAAQQSQVYAQQVFDLAQASAELARRMQAAGNFSRLQHMRHQAFFSQASVQLKQAQQEASGTRETLIRRLGLSEPQAQVLKLPDRLPTCPDQPRSPDEISRVVSTQRLDIQLAQAEYTAAAAAQGLQAISSFTDIEVGVLRNTVFNAAGTKTQKSGYEISVRLPLFDWGDNQRQAMNAQTLAAAYRLEAALRVAGSQVRESYAAYRTAFDNSEHHRAELVPLHKTILDENVLRYNAMQIGVFELLAEARAQISSVLAAIAAEQQFWLADALLQAALVGSSLPAANGVGSRSATLDAGGNDVVH